MARTEPKYGIYRCDGRRWVRVTCCGKRVFGRWEANQLAVNGAERDGQARAVYRVGGEKEAQKRPVLLLFPEESPDACKVGPRGERLR